MNEHICHLMVRSYECDTFGHVNNAVYLNYLEYARCEFLKSRGMTVQGLREAGCSLVVVRISIQYLRQSRTDDELQIVTRPLKKGKGSGVFFQRILCRGENVAEAEVTWACIGEDGKPVRFPPQLEAKGLEP